MERPARAATRRNGEVFPPHLDALLLVRAGDGVLETVGFVEFP
jgi:hypothetical protein